MKFSPEVTELQLASDRPSPKALVLTTTEVWLVLWIQGKEVGQATRAGGSGPRSSPWRLECTC